MRPLPDGGSTPTSAAVPQTLLTYARLAGELDDDLTAALRRAGEDFARFSATRPDLPYCIADPTPAAATYARRNADVDAWVGRIGAAFVRADTTGFLCSLTPHLVTVDDGALAAAGFPTREEARAAARALADVVKAGLDGAVSEDTLRSWGSQLTRYGRDAFFTAAFFERLGVEGTVKLPKMIEAAWPRDCIGRPDWGLDVLRPFSEALATALPATAASYRNGLADYVPGYSASSPEEYHLGLLFASGSFPADFLVRLGANVVVPPIADQRFSWPLHPTAWGPGIDPVANVLGAIARNPDASLRFVQAEEWTPHTNLELLLERWSADLDGDGGRAAAEVVRQALTSTSTAAAESVFDDTLSILGRVDSIRNPYLGDVVAEAAVVHIGHLATLASTEGDDVPSRLDAAQRGLTAALSDQGAARRVYDAALREVYDTFAAAEPGSDLAAAAWRVGSLLGLVESADAHAREVSTSERIARRQALLDGLTRITDLGLTFTSGRWIPFAAAGRDALLDHFRNDDELDRTLTDVHEFEARVRYQLSAVIAVRLAADGRLRPPFPLRPLDEMSGAQRAEFDGWLNSTPVREAITAARTVAGQRMDELENLLRMPG